MGAGGMLISREQVYATLHHAVHCNANPQNAIERAAPKGVQGGYGPHSVLASTRKEGISDHDRRFLPVTVLGGAAEPSSM